MMLFSHPSTISLFSDQQYLKGVLTASVVTILFNAAIAHVPSYVAPELLSQQTNHGLKCIRGSVTL